MSRTPLSATPTLAIVWSVVIILSITAGGVSLIGATSTSSPTYSSHDDPLTTTVDSTPTVPNTTVNDNTTDTVDETPDTGQGTTDSVAPSTATVQNTTDAIRNASDTVKNATIATPDTLEEAAAKARNASKANVTDPTITDRGPLTATSVGPSSRDDIDRSSDGRIVVASPTAAGTGGVEESGSGDTSTGVAPTSGDGSGWVPWSDTSIGSTITALVTAISDAVGVLADTFGTAAMAVVDFIEGIIGGTIDDTPTPSSNDCVDHLASTGQDSSGSWQATPTAGSFTPQTTAKHSGTIRSSSTTRQLIHRAVLVRAERKLASCQELFADGRESATMPSRLATQRTNLRGSGTLLDIIEATPESQHGNLSQGVKLATVGTKLQAAQIDSGTQPIAPSDVTLPETQTPAHDEPSTAAFAILEAHDVTPTPQQTAEIRGLDDLPEPTKSELTDVLNAYLVYYQATQAAYVDANQSRLKSLTNTSVTELRAINTDSATSRFSRTTSRPAGVDPGLHATGVDIYRILSARLTLMKATQELNTALTEPRAPVVSRPASHSLPQGGGVQAGPISINLSTHDNTYDDDYALQIDRGGDDTYNNNAGGASGSVISPEAAALIDLGGNDTYDGRNGGAFAGSGFLVDASGHDRYTSGVDASNGGGMGGTGFLLDAGWGNDSYTARGRASNGGGNAGVGFLMDTGNGTTSYKGGKMGTNGGGQGGTGFLLDGGGSDRYTASKSAANGGGVIGNGFLLDVSGNDTYNSTKEAINGGGVFGGSGFLLDAAGDDAYTAGSLGTNGGGNFSAVGSLIDLGGNDAYSAGRGGVNGGADRGMGLLLDGDGTDAYADKSGAYTGGSCQDCSKIPKGTFGAQADISSAETPPRILQFNVTVVQSGGPDNATVVATWNVSDSSLNLDTVNLTLRDLNASDDGINDTATVDVDGAVAMGSTNLSLQNVTGHTYAVRLVVTDENNNTDSRRRQAVIPWPVVTKLNLTTVDKGTSNARFAARWFVSDQNAESDEGHTVNLTLHDLNDSEVEGSVDEGGVGKNFHRKNEFVAHNEWGSGHTYRVKFVVKDKDGFRTSANDTVVEEHRPSQFRNETTKTTYRQWRTLSGNPARTGHIETTSPVGSIGVLWNETTTGKLSAVVNGTVYAVGEDGKIIAMDAKTGAVLREFATNGGGGKGADLLLEFGLTVVNDTIFMPSPDTSSVYALDTQTGIVEWNVSIEGKKPRKSPAVVNDTVYVTARNSSGDDWLYALDTDTGSKRWRYQIKANSELQDSRVHGSPAVANGTVITATDEGVVQAVDVTSGDLRWKHEFGQQEMQATPAVANGTVFVGEKMVDAHGTGRLLALDVKTGKLKWKFSGGNDLEYSPAVVNGMVYAGWDPRNDKANSNPSLLSNTSVYALDTNTGEVQWSFEEPTSEPIYPPAVVDNIAYFASSDTVYALDAQTGEETWQFAPEAKIKSGPAVVNSKVFFTTKASGNTPYNIHTLTGALLNYSDLTVSPRSIVTGESVTVTATVTNSGVGQGPYNASLIVDGTVVTTKRGTVEEGAHRKITFTHPFVEAGTYTVTIEDLPAKTVTVTPAWPQYGAVPGHTGHTGTTGPKQYLTDRWNFSTGGGVVVSAGGVRSSPAVVNGTLAVGSDDSSVYALDTATGTERWEFDTKGNVSSSPALVSDTVYVGSADGTVYALDAEMGDERWSFTTVDVSAADNAVTSSPTVVDGTVYVGSNNGKVFAINAKSGEKLWQFATYGAVRSSPAVVDGTVYVGSDDGHVYALNADTGDLRRSYSIGSAVRSSPAVVAGTVYVGADNGTVYAFDSRTSTVEWQFTTGAAVQSSPAVVGSTIYVGSNNGNVYALDAGTGAEKWQFATGGAVQSSPAVVESTVYVGSNDGHVYALDAQNGTELSHFTTNGAVQSSPAVVNGTVYVGSMDKMVYALTEGTAPPSPTPTATPTPTNGGGGGDGPGSGGGDGPGSGGGDGPGDGGGNGPGGGSSDGTPDETSTSGGNQVVQERSTQTSTKQEQTAKATPQSTSTPPPQTPPPQTPTDTPTDTPTETPLPTLTPTPEVVPGFGLAIWFVAFWLLAAVVVIRRRD